MSHKSRHKRHKHVKERYYSRDHDDGHEEKKQPKTKTKSQEMPAKTADMTPAERLREKMKLLLDKANDNSATPTINKPDEMEIMSIESDQFVAQSFQSSRNQSKESIAPSTLLHGGRGHNDAIFGTAKTLPTLTSSMTTPTISYDISDEMIEQNVIRDDAHELRLKWIKKLTELRNKYTHPPID